MHSQFNTSVCHNQEEMLYLLIIEQPYSTSTCIFMMYTLYHFCIPNVKKGVACKNWQSKAKYIYHMSMCDKSGKLIFEWMHILVKKGHNKTSLVWILAHVDSAAVHVGGKFCGWKILLVENFVGVKFCGWKMSQHSPRLTMKTRNIITPQN